MLSLMVVNGRQRGQAYHVKGERPALIGRHAAEVQLHDSRVSRKHARIYLEDGQWWIEDLGSSNGTWVNKQSILEPTALNEGDRLHIGRLQLVVDRATVDPAYDGTAAAGGGEAKAAGDDAAGQAADAEASAEPIPMDDAEPVDSGQSTGTSELVGEDDLDQELEAELASILSSDSDDEPFDPEVDLDLSDEVDDAVDDAVDDELSPDDAKRGGDHGGDEDELTGR